MSVETYNAIWIAYISENKSVTEIAKMFDLTRRELIKLGLK